MPTFIHHVFNHYSVILFVMMLSKCDDTNRYMVMKPAVDKDDPTYVQMHSAISQSADTIRDSMTISDGRPPSRSINGVGTNTFTNTPSAGEYMISHY